MEVARLLVASLQRAQAQQMTRQIFDVLVYLPRLQWERGEAAQAWATASFLLGQDGLADAQSAVLQERMAVMEKAETAVPQQQAKALASQLSIDSLTETFLREGLRWFAPRKN